MADRPLECSECKKPISINYVEIVGKQCSEHGMCSDCHALQKKLHGTSPGPNQSGRFIDGGSGLCCGTCNTSLDSVRMGHPLGCQECYVIFGEVLVKEMLASGDIYDGAAKKQRSLPLHSGRCPGEILQEGPARRLMMLNEALTETLDREDYEQAAHLRDQIKELTEGEDVETEQE